MHESMPLAVLRFFESANIADAQLALRVVTLMVQGRQQTGQHASPTTEPSVDARLPRKNGIRTRAAAVLATHGDFMSGEDLTALMNLRFDAEYVKSSVVGIVAHHVRQGETFCRPELGKYGLIEWKDAGPPRSQLDSPAANDGTHDMGAAAGDNTHARPLTEEMR